MPYPLTASGANPYGPEISFRTENVLPPASVYVGPDDALLLEARAPSVAAQLDVSLRRLMPTGEISSDFYSWRISTAGDNIQTQLVPPAEGYILSVHMESDTPKRGQLFCKLHARHNLSGTDPTLGHLLVQGYVSHDDHLGFPQSPTESSLSGHGWLRAIAMPSVPRGSQLSYTVPPGVCWLLRAVTGLYTTSAIGNPREAYLQFTDPAGVVQMFIPAGNTQAPTAPVLTSSYTWAPGLMPAQSGGVYTAGLPQDLLLAAGWTVNTGVQGADTNPATGDFWQQLAVSVEEYVST